ncbi:hypothetical protein ACODTN_04325 [Acinetobacter pittii]|uniref:hypothetical protein n=1 Tax=Acinetobacter TaxID=469 RepID=UPI0011A8B0FB|nr:hypothetical protein [Acinetobacter oleivorans]
MIKRYTVDIANTDHKKITAIGFAKLLDFIVNGDVEKVILLVPQIGNFQHVGLAEIIDSLGHKIFNSKKLKKDHVIQINNSEIELVSSRDIKKIRQADVLFAYCSSGKDLTVIDQLSGIKNIIYIPWIPEEQAEWIKKWNPEIIPT